jgi:hypothetical protein
VRVSVCGTDTNWAVLRERVCALARIPTHRCTQPCAQHASIHTCVRACVRGSSGAVVRVGAWVRGCVGACVGVCVRVCVRVRVRVRVCVRVYLATSERVCLSAPARVWNDTNWAVLRVRACAHTPASVNAPVCARMHVCRAAGGLRLYAHARACVRACGPILIKRYIHTYERHASTHTRTPHRCVCVRASRLRVCPSVHPDMRAAIP